ncbi:MAG: AAA family ATPase [Rudanella sp.]|nr:AAA family ATPase [Rudanella sp.]
MQPSFYVVAGPNGVGKSTASFQYLSEGVELINSDDIARQIRHQQQHQEVVQRMTNEESQRRIQTHLKNRETFAVETNLHEADTWQYFLALQQAGYAFRLIFMCVDDLTVLNQRVISRYQQGGHFVREDIIRGRYEAGLLLLNHFFDEPDVLMLIDGSAQPELIFQRIDREVKFQNTPLPEWVIKHLSTHFQDIPPATPTTSLSSIDGVRTRYNQLKQTPIQTPDEPSRL